MNLMNLQQFILITLYRILNVANVGDRQLKQIYQTIIFFHKVMMAVNKMERQIDPLSIGISKNTDIEEQKPLSQERNVLDLQVTGIKTEYMDRSCNVETEMTFHETPVSKDFPVVKSEVEEGNDLDLHVTEIKTEYMDPSNDLKSDITCKKFPVPINCPIVKSEVEEGNVSHLEVTCMKTECVDQSCDVKSEIKVHDTTPVPSSFSMVKSEVHENLFNVDRIQKEQKVKVSSEEDKVLTESIVHDAENSVSREHDGINCEEDILKQCGSNRPDCSNISDVSRNTTKCNICNQVFVTQQSLKHHFHIHTIKKSFHCDVCGRCFLRFAELKQHAPIHTGERQFKCNVCGKGFTRLSHLSNHERIHKGEWPYKCDVCGKGLSALASSWRHARIHTRKIPNATCVGSVSQYRHF
ncbi:zinc finger protein 454-like isoform X2 [Periplaneta americana]|uniref:zinc finger protein 454-like isoform X2 n=1 Tax=Periplaneta americana TaxID=6978 RepID=UPI0037E77A51